MVFTSVQIKLKRLAGISGLLQAFSWTIMTVVCIKIWKNESNPGIGRSYMSVVRWCMYTYLFNDSAGLFHNTISPSSFEFTLIVYMIVSLVWIATSVYILFRREALLKYWGLWTLLVCIVDFIVVIILGTDYDKCTSAVPPTYPDLDIPLEIPLIIVLEGFCANGILPVLIIAARGFVLWIFNFSLAIIITRISWQTQGRPQFRFFGLGGPTYTNPQIQQQQLQLQHQPQQLQYHPQQQLQYHPQHQLQPQSQLQHQLPQLQLESRPTDYPQHHHQDSLLLPVTSIQPNRSNFPISPTPHSPVNHNNAPLPNLQNSPSSLNQQNSTADQTQQPRTFLRRY